MSWMPRSEWDALVRGEGCPLCTTLRSTAASDQHGLTVADLPSGLLRLVRNQFVKGYCLLIHRRHIREPYELSDSDRRQFFDDLSRVGATLERLFQADKMNFQILGNSVPHLHAHIEPRYYGDPAGGRPIHAGDGELYLSEEQYRQRVASIREAMEAW